MTIKISDTYGNRNSDLPAFSVVPQKSAPQRAPSLCRELWYFIV